MTEPPVEDLMAGLEGPLPLPADLRSRLEAQLLSGVLHEEPVPLDAGQRADLLAALTPAASRRRRRATVVGSAAAGIAAALVGVLVLSGQGDSGRARTSALPTPSPTVSEPALATPSATPSRASSALSGGTAWTGGGPFTSSGPTSGPASGPAGAPAPVTGSGGASRSTAPQLDGLRPRSGQAGVWVVLTGRNLSDVRAVRFGAARATDVQLIDSTRLRARAPEQGLGEVDIRVVTPAGASNAQPFRYLR